MNLSDILALTAVVVVASATSQATSTSATLWNRANCPDGNVTDLVCCRDDRCGKLGDKDACNREKTCLWTKSNAGDFACKSNRDANNNVCCMTKVSEFCGTIVNGICPEAFEVPAECCSEKGMRYTGVLSVGKPGHVCCNTPCQEAMSRNCTVPKHCLQTQGRSLDGDDYEVDYGFNRNLLKRQPYGTIIPYTGFENRYYHLPTPEQSYVGNVKEITVDDIMSSLVDALSNDKDVYQYSSSTYSDPILGKQTFGGLLGGFKYPDPNIFVDSIYGSPYGLSQGQFGFQGRGWPQVRGVFPGRRQDYDNYGSRSYGYGSPYGRQSYGQSAYGSQSYGQSGYDSR